jgi:hypothetical protein
MKKSIMIQSQALSDQIIVTIPAMIQSQALSDQIIVTIPAISNQVKKKNQDSASSNDSASMN